jgi:hypothetical protein
MTAVGVNVALQDKICVLYVMDLGWHVNAVVLRTKELSSQCAIKRCGKDILTNLE